ncbi:MAG: hypothetical protein Q8Q24_02420 [bacterium]|nr:hypothetical protein [bacterium]
MLNKIKKCLCCFNTAPLERNLAILIFLFVFFYPLGVVLMWVWMKNWQKWFKILISAPLIISLLNILVAIFLTIVLPNFQ